MFAPFKKGEIQHHRPDQSNRVQMASKTEKLGKHGFTCDNVLKLRPLKDKRRVRDGCHSVRKLPARDINEQYGINGTVC